MVDICKKDDAQPVCPNCGTEMVRARFQLEDGSWMHCWLCECPVDETSRVAGQGTDFERTIKLLVAAGHVTEEQAEKARKIAADLR